MKQSAIWTSDRLTPSASEILLLTLFLRLVGTGSVNVRPCANNDSGVLNIAGVLRRMQPR